MGNSASKATSAAKQAATKSTRAAGLNQQPLASSSRSAPSTSAPPPPSQRPTPRASETKDESIIAESRDPDLAKNLRMLGQVKVPGKGMASTLHTDNAMLGILQERQRVDDAVAAGISTPNQLSARSLSNLLDDRKSAKSKEEADQIAVEYGMDPELVRTLARHVNSPSISMVLPSSDPDEDDRRLAKWVDPPAEEQPRLGA
ncbi:uncharacterized protein JCM6883_000650 [Sporobolomyces salmoneus]|uniref:uncharacterized protein n=1 Tax=Sporobolomyces salmoneus TaxID=183962 RepID=UPI0031767E2B